MFVARLLLIFDIVSLFSCLKSVLALSHCHRNFISLRVKTDNYGKTWPFSKNFFNVDSIQGAGLDTVPASHTHILKYNRRFESPVYLFYYLMCAWCSSNTQPFIRIAFPRLAYGIVYQSKWFFWLHKIILSYCDLNLKRLNVSLIFRISIVATENSLKSFLFIFALHICERLTMIEITSRHRLIHWLKSQYQNITKMAMHLLILGWGALLWPRPICLKTSMA